MIEDQLLEEFRRQFADEIVRSLEDVGEDTPMRMDVAVFAAAAGDLQETGAITGYDLCAYEDRSGRDRVRIVGYQLEDDATRLDLFTAVHVPGDAPGHLPDKDVEKALSWCARFFKHAAKGDLKRFEGNAEVLAAARRIRRELSSIEEVRVHLVTNSLVRDRGAEAVKVEERPVEFSIWDLERLHRARAEEITRDRIEVDFQALTGRPLACVEMKPQPQDYQTFLAVLPGEVLARLYDAYGDKLFEFNVRSFLQAKGKVNKGIRRTIEDHPERFLAYNNGMTATADEIEAGQWHGETVILRVRGLQVVNGAQTTASVHRAWKDRKDVAQVAVAMKLTRVAADHLEEFIPLIAQYANTQNPVQLADLSANNGFHIAIERLAESNWCPPDQETRWFYERARGGYAAARARLGSTAKARRAFDQAQPKSQLFTKTDLAKYLMAWWGLPHIVGRGSQKNFAEFMRQIPDRFGKEWQPDNAFLEESIAKAIIFKAAQKVARDARLASGGAPVVVAMMVARIAQDFADRLDLGYAWEAQAVSDGLRDLMAQWTPLLYGSLREHAGTELLTEYGKKEAAWRMVADMELPQPEHPLPEFTAEDVEEIRPDEVQAGPAFPRNGTRPSNPDETKDLFVSRCVELDGDTWMRVIDWAVGSALVSDKDRNIANALALWARQGWKQRPSEKQAYCAVRVLNAAQRSGII